VRVRANGLSLVQRLNVTQSHNYHTAKGAAVTSLTNCGTGQSFFSRWRT